MSSKEECHVDCDVHETRSYSPKEDNGVYLDLGDNEIA